MAPVNHKAPKLPQSLLDQVQPSKEDHGRQHGGRKQGPPLGRKEKRKALREQKKSDRRPHRTFPTRHQDHEEDDNELSEGIEVRLHISSPAVESAKINSGPKSILKKPKKETKAVRVQGQEPEKQVFVSRAVKAQLDDDDAEIAALEKRLGMKGKKKLPKVFDDDGLGDLLDGLDDYLDESTQKRKRGDYDEWLKRKRRRVDSDLEESEDSSGDDEGLFPDTDNQRYGPREENGSSDVDEDEVTSDHASQSEALGIGGGFAASGTNIEGLMDDFEGFESEALDLEEPKRKRENPYVPPVSATLAATSKYIPPYMRDLNSSDGETMTRLRRQLQGLLNKLSEANLVTVLRDVERIYSSHPRQYVTSILIDLLMGLLCDRTSLMDTFIILHAGFIAAVCRVIGPHFGAQLLERLVADFEKQYESEKRSNDGHKEASNLATLLAELYTFQLVGSNLIFDYIRLFLAELTDLNTELLLKIIKNCGPQLRQDDPSSLKDIVLLLQKSVAQVGEVNLSVRTKFMIETINNLKNNRQKTGLAASSIASEHTSRMKKVLGSLHASTGKGSEPLGVTLTDIKSSSKEGKWWLVGASWKNETSQAGTTSESNRLKESSEPSIQEQKTDDHEDTDADILQMAKEQRMNTDIRRAIFVNIMSASDYKDAHMRLTKLKLKKAQELEIPRVLLHCAGAEQSYNPYYTLIARRLCSEHRFKWAFQYGLWDLFKRMGEKGSLKVEDDETDDDEADEEIGLRKIVNLGRMYGRLVADDAVSLTALKVLNFAYLQPNTKSLLEILVLTSLKTISKNAKDTNTDASRAISEMLIKARDTPQVISGLQYFLAKQCSPTDFASDASERKALKSTVRIARSILASISSEPANGLGTSEG